MLLSLLLACTWLDSQPASDWESIFNGKNLDGWTAKIRGYALGDNFANTFRVRDGKIVVDYDGYGGKFEGRFGHLFYKSSLSDYMIRLEYRFVGKQLADGPGWGYKNSGIMLHCQDPKSMGKDQDFPVSGEFQFLGGDDTGERPTGSVCSPGTNLVIDGKLITQHTTNSSSPTYRGEVWVKAEAEVHGYGTIIHRIEGKEVMRYEQLQLDPNDADAKFLIKDGNLAIRGGWISLQSESHPCEFRNIEIKRLP